MQARDRIRGALGGALVAAALALSGPGLQVARADDDPGFTTDPRLVELVERRDRAEPADPAACEASRTPAREVVAMERRMQAMRAAAQRQLARHGGDSPAGSAIQLNNRGYNY